MPVTEFNVLQRKFSYYGEIERLVESSQSFQSTSMSKVMEKKFRKILKIALTVFLIVFSRNWIFNDVNAGY